MATKLTSIRIPEDLSERYGKLAELTERTRAFYYVEALSDAIDHLEYEYGLMKKVEDYRADGLETLDELGGGLGLVD